MTQQTNPKTAGAHTAADGDRELSADEVEALVREYDSESNFRNLVGPTAMLVTIASVALSLFHVYTAGFGLLNEVMHRTIHLSFVMGLIFLVFPRKRAVATPKLWVESLIFAGFYLYILYDIAMTLPPSTLKTVFVVVVMALVALTLPVNLKNADPGKVAVRDWVFAAFGAGFSAYLTIFFKHIFIDNVGSPPEPVYMMGVVAIIMTLEATRRTMGPMLAWIGIGCLLYALVGPYLPGILAHRGYSITRIVNHLFIGTEGIYGVAVGVVATYVFHFVLFGILAQMSGLGQLFIDLATIIAGRASGGSAKVSVVSSGFFGMISGSPIANTVTTGAFTIPLMKKSGFSGRFAGAVEASASCGGQITPPIMGASAFVMTEMLGIPYNELILIAIVPACFHYIAILLMVHLEAKKLGLEGLSKDKIPQFGAVLKKSWHLFIPLGVMVAMLLMQYTPFLAAFWGIILTIAFSYVPLVMRALGNTDMDTSTVLTPPRLVRGFEDGAKFALAIGAACACVGFLLGMTTLTGLGFKFSGAVVQLAHDVAGVIIGLDFTGLLSENGMALFFGLIFVAIACIIMGAGIPTTPTYIILASIAAPALMEFDVPLVATHFFVFYFGVLADVTPPVALAAYAAAGLARSEPMSTGTTAFRLSMGKALVPFMFIYAPSLLFVNFTWVEFITALLSGLLGILALSAAYIGWFRRDLVLWEKAALTLAGLLLISTYWAAIAVGVLTLASVLFRPGTRTSMA
ncbi:TRAP transporter permease [Sulfitobacter pseudonitzschiae]|uniref:TRAP transporter permease n=1 Tax=Pseudosulfitobacter pseudonitzschiae TaxID=1402135 RepID=A0A9Q2NLU1_9RHOB|nr:TRAP transporter permease [Pseudosulfitobacter pseudonitzschiae]MBM2294333.1 TRAP transporter permease [Pseudosulfitobacter pseudonitzschiae]MBM2299258.1 TRAP transporter permease [Pseudosulfitobacter pseudonitzschiae]MBM2304166.1 TRAP transporter permease [Pseudosulfitobacter pseudonitzschiae]MBM2313946.1 TRAP transporter permease [Pseudosulfitobacter pseudonitzschiae]MBM2318860.1 TRAP transporter permease [Pseudosulfitobacter pseudonitzschiae]